MQRSGIGLSQIWSELFVHPGNRCSMIGLGAVLSQVQDDGSIYPLAYASRSIDKHECNYGISELEIWNLCGLYGIFVPAFLFILVLCTRTMLLVCPS